MTATSAPSLNLLAASAAAKPAEAGDYFALLKPRVMSLVVFTGLIGLIAAPGHLHLFQGFMALLCIALGAGGAGAFNMWHERYTDGLMTRTAKRPLPAGRIMPEDALSFAVSLCVASVALMGLALNMAAALWLAASILFYTGVYTVWLKRRTPQNIVIGGAAGALPPVIGWTAVTGSAAALEPWLLFLMIFLWTPPHFWALALVRGGEYAKAGIPMLPVVRGRLYTLRHMVLYTLALVAVSVVPTLLHYAPWWYGVVAVVLGGVFLIAVTAIVREEAPGKLALRAFAVSIAYLFLLFLTYGISISV